MTCAKRRVRCTIVDNDGRAAVGENLCRTPQATCPREPGEDYTKCVTICDQVGHAETVALSAARFEGLDLTNAEALIEGHSYACVGCQQNLHEAGIRTIHFGAEWLPHLDRWVIEYRGELRLAQGIIWVGHRGEAPDALEARAQRDGTMWLEARSLRRWEPRDGDKEGPRFATPNAEPSSAVRGE